MKQAKFWSLALSAALLVGCSQSGEEEGAESDSANNESQATSNDGGTELASLKNGLQPGDRIDAFYVTKVAGAPEDGVEAGGDPLCYRCKLGNRPVVAIFTRKVDDNVAQLVSKVDDLVAANQDKEMGSFVNVLGESSEAAKQSAQQLAEKASTKQVAVVVPEKVANGDDHLKLKPETDVTVLIYKDGVIAKNHSLNQSQLNDGTVQSILMDAKSLLN